MRNGVGIAIIIAIGVIWGGALSTNVAASTPQRPSDSYLMAFKVYHHTVYCSVSKESGQI